MTRGVQHAALRILVVEDADPVRALVVSALTRDGCAVEEASGLVEARARLSEGRPDVVGEEVLRRLRADPRTSATPVVVLSADATAGQGQRLRANGATDYLTKPFDVHRLLAVIDGAGSADQPTALPEEQGGHRWPLDPTIVASLHDLGRDSEAGAAGIRDLVTTFLHDSGWHFADLRIAVSEGDVAGVERLAHSLAGSSANFGARNVAEGCKEVETRARAGDLGDVPMLVARLDEAFTVARTALRAEFLDDGDPSP